MFRPPYTRQDYNNCSVFPLNNNSKCENNNSNAFKTQYNMSTILHNITSSKAYISIHHSTNANQGKKNNNDSNSISTYKDPHFKGSSEDYKKKLDESNTIYVGYLNLVTSKNEIHTRFSCAGKIKKIIMGIDNETSGPGGFCFVEYAIRLGAETCMKTMVKTILDGKKLKIDWDAGFIEGRQYRRENAKKRFSLSSIYPPLN